MKFPESMSELVKKIKDLVDDFLGKTTENKAESLRNAVPRELDVSVGPVDSGIKKEYLQYSDACRVTFRLPREAVRDARTVTLVGDFNGWDRAGTPMKRLTSGEFMLEVELPRNREYRFKYLIDSSQWENDWHADRYDANSYGSDDSVVIIR